MSEEKFMEEPVQAALQPQEAPEALFGKLERVFEEQHDRVFRAAYRVTGNVMDAEDVLQTVFLRLLHHVGSPALEEHAGSYLHRAAINAALELVRRRTPSNTLPLESIERFADPQPGPDAIQDGQESRDCLRRALSRLNPRAAEIFALRYFEGCGNREIARILGTSWSSVAVTLHRTRARLRREISGGVE